MWGEPPRTPPAVMRKVAEMRVASLALAEAVGAFLERGTTGNIERLREAYDAYQAAVLACATARPRSGW